MRISRIQIQNFRNFESLDVSIGKNAVILGENGIGKSNLLFALRLILDPTLPDSVRHLGLEDFWDGLKRPLSADDKISISVDFSDFEGNPDHLAVLGEHLVETEPMVSRLTYEFKLQEDLEDDPASESDYEFVIFGGGRPENTIGYEVRKEIPIELMPALRDAESDLASWGRSPLRPLLNDASSRIDVEELRRLAGVVTKATEEVAGQEEVKQLAESITDELQAMIGETHATDVKLGFSSTDPEKLIRSLQLLIDGGMRGIRDASLGSANIIYLTLKTMDLSRKIEEEGRCHTFLAIEEPEAHLHPHLQRRVYRNFLQTRQSDDEEPFPATVLLTTHSPHVASITPVNSFVLLKKSDDGDSTIGAATANLKLSDRESDDIERYLDVTRGELLFAKGVLLVEGEAEQYLVPALADSLGYDLDELGITVCSVAGIHFDSYLKFIGPDGLDLSFAVVTDEDPRKDGKDEESHGLIRVRKLLEIVAPDEIDDDDDDEDHVIEVGNLNGIFMTDHTLEVALFKCGRKTTFATAMSELSTNGAAKKRAIDWKKDPESLDPIQLLKDIDEVGKGRFSQRWSSVILNSKKVKLCPDSIKDAIKHVVDSIIQ